MPTVVTPKSFFVNERRHYSNWRFAFWREFFQNSIDAGAGNIDISIKRDENNKIIVVFSDNGSGMTREILDSVYFRLGETTKKGDDSVGGFGRARILTCFSMDSYEIRTLNLLVKGSGGEYTIDEVDSILYGTRVTIVIDNESMDSIQNALSEYLCMSQMACSVHVNGERWRDWSYRRVLCRNLAVNGEEFAGVYVNKSASIHRIIVRVNGTAMYSRYISAHAQIIVEIFSSLSRKVLTANRDGMAEAYSLALDNFANEIASETLSALKPRFKKKSTSFKGGGLISAVGSNKPAPVSSEFNQPVSIGSNVVPAGKDFIAAIDFSTKEEKSNNEMKFGVSFAKDLPDIYLEDETENPKIRRVIDSYNPANWEKMIGANGKEYNKGGTIYKLLMFWKIACQEAVRSLVDWKGKANFDWGIGWIFNEDFEAMHISRNEGHYFLLNPVTSDGTLRYKLSSKRDRKILMALAKHEVAHVYCRNHDELFASCLTGIDCEYNEKSAHSQMQEFLQVSNCG
jgi:hypothetical protein